MACAATELPPLRVPLDQLSRPNATGRPLHKLLVHGRQGAPRARGRGSAATRAHAEQEGYLTWACCWVVSLSDDYNTTRRVQGRKRTVQDSMEREQSPSNIYQKSSSAPPFFEGLLCARACRSYISATCRGVYCMSGRTLLADGRTTYLLRSSGGRSVLVVPYTYEAREPQRDSALVHLQSR